MDNIYTYLPAVIGGVVKDTAILNKTWDMDGLSNTNPVARSDNYNDPVTRRVNLISWYEWQEGLDNDSADPTIAFTAEPLANSVGDFWCRAQYGTPGTSSNGGVDNNCLGQNIYSAFRYPWLRSARSNTTDFAWVLYGYSTNSLSSSNTSVERGVLPTLWISSSVCVSGDTGTLVDPYQFAACPITCKPGNTPSTSPDSIWSASGDAAVLGDLFSRVGIGTNDPRYSLDVAGVTASEGLIVAGEATVSGTLTAQEATLTKLKDAYGNYGQAGQILSTDETGVLKWVNLLPAGGTDGQVLSLENGTPTWTDQVGGALVPDYTASVSGNLTLEGSKGARTFTVPEDGFYLISNYLYNGGVGLPDDIGDGWMTVRVLVVDEQDQTLLTLDELGRAWSQEITVLDWGTTGTYYLTAGTRLKLIARFGNSDAAAYTANNEAKTYIRRVPSKYVGGVGGGSGVMVPDYAKMETTNVISTVNGTWTADKTGYVRCYSVTQDTSGAQIGLIMRVNGVSVSGNLTYPVSQYDAIAMVPVAVNDTVAVQVVGGNAVATVSCRFIPPKYVGGGGGSSELDALTARVATLESAVATMSAGTGFASPDYASASARVTVVDNVTWTTTTTNFETSPVFGTYTVPDDGYVSLDFGSLRPADGTHYIISINNKRMVDEALTERDTSNGSGGLGYVGYSKLLPVARGDVIKFQMTSYHVAGTYTNIALYATFIPPKYAGGGSGGSSSGAVFTSPDYAKMENINRIATITDTWTVTQNGFVKLLVGNDTTGNSNVAAGFRINGKDVLSSGDVLAGALSLGNAVLPVKTGDVVSAFKQVNTTIRDLSCYFIPPIYSQPTAPIVVEGSDYSTSEQPVMVNDGGTLRAKRWLDGWPIYRRAFNNTPFGDLNGMAAGATDIKSLSNIIPNIRSITNEFLNVTVTNVVTMGRVGGNTTGSGVIGNSLQTSLKPDSASLFFRNNFGSVYPADGANIYLFGWVEYTKTTDTGISSASVSDTEVGMTSVTQSDSPVTANSFQNPLVTTNPAELAAAFAFDNSDSALTADERLAKIESDFAALSNDLTFLAEYDIEVMQAKIDLRNFFATSSNSAITDQVLLLAEVINASGDALAFSSPVHFESLVTAQNGLLVEGEATISGRLNVTQLSVSPDMAGVLTVPAGTTSATYHFSTALDHPPIVNLTPILHGYRYYLESATAAEFSVYVHKTPEASASFNWSAVTVH
jgi:hypothetical protein